MFRVKICGITCPADARLAVEAGADAIGLNFYPQSPRYCALEQARAIALALPRHVCKVGVFVNATLETIGAAAAEVPLDLIQLHGDETPEFARQVCPLPVMRALRVGADLAPVSEYLKACHRLRAVPRLLLLDAARAGQFGGTGATLDWELLATGRGALGGMPLVLAGGLTPANVAEAIRVVRPWGVDVASGVETKPGQKSAELVRQFVAQAHAAFARK